MFIVVSRFKDLTDNEFEYNIGDIFPRKEKSMEDISKERLEELTTDKNKKKTILIKEINVEKNTTLDVDKKENSKVEGEPTPVADEKADLKIEEESTTKTDDKNTNAGNKSTKNKN